MTIREIISSLEGYSGSDEVILQAPSGRILKPLRVFVEDGRVVIQGWWATAKALGMEDKQEEQEEVQLNECQGRTKSKRKTKAAQKRVRSEDGKYLPIEYIKGGTGRPRKMVRMPDGTYIRYKDYKKS